MNQTLNILIIEDNADAVFLISEMLAHNVFTNFKVESASRLSEAFLRLEKGGIDAALLDLELPDSQGLPTFQKLQKAAPQMPIVVLTGRNDQGLALELAKAGAQDFIVKGSCLEDILVRSIRYAIERKLTEKNLRESEERFRVLFESSNDALMTLEPPSWNFTTCNTATQKIFVCKDEQEFCARPPWQLSPELQPDGRLSSDKAKEMIEITMLKGSNRFEWMHRRTTGENFPASVLLTKVIISGKELLQATVRDITENKKMAEEMLKSQKLESVGLLAGGIAHDFNNILTGIIGNISIVRRNLKPTDESALMLAEAEKGVFQAKNLTLQLLAFAKGGKPEKKPTALLELLTENVTFAARGAKFKPEFHISPDLHIVNIDPGQISQVINNITINAAQAMPEGGAFSVTAQNIVLNGQEHIPLEVGRYIVITLSDTGGGISAENKRKIFDPYFTTKKTGTGLGLASSYNIIKNHGGYLTVESEVGKGSSFLIYLPVFTGAYKAAVSVRRKEIKKGRGRVLVLDDEPNICNVIKRIMAGLGYTAESDMDGDSAIERYRKTWETPEAFDAVILDLTVPGGKGGLEVVAELKRINPRLKAVVSSGYSNDTVVSNYKDYGFSATLSKPYTIEEVSETLHNLLNTTKD